MCLVVESTNRPPLATCLLTMCCACWVSSAGSAAKGCRVWLCNSAGLLQRAGELGLNPVLFQTRTVRNRSREIYVLLATVASMRVSHWHSTTLQGELTAVLMVGQN
jgi:hypothetical protein